MLNTLFMVLSTSYIAWYLERFELTAVYPFDATYAAPDEAGVPGLAETRIATPDGEELVVWKVEKTESKPTVLYFSGNSGTLKDRAERFRHFSAAGFGVVAPAYRGSSGSTGQPDEATLMDDARLVAAAIDGPVVIYGESLGAAVAIRLAAEGTGRRVVLEAPFTSVEELVAVQFPTEKVEHLITQRWNSIESVSSLRQPLLVIHGETDAIVPFKMGQRVYHEAGSEEKTLLAVAGLGHTQLWSGEVPARVLAFFAD